MGSVHLKRLAETFLFGRFGAPTKISCLNCRLDLFRIVPLPCSGHLGSTLPNPPSWPP